MAVRKLKYPFTLSQGTGVFISNTGVDFDGSAPLTYQIGVGNDIFTTGKVQFSAVTSSTSAILVGTTTFTDSLWDGSFSSNGLSVTGSLTISGNATVQGNVTAEEIISELTSSMALFKSGSTLFGDTIGDNHYITGSLYETGSFELNGYSVKEISSDVLLADSSSTALVTERAFKTYMDTTAGGIDSATNTYLRKSYNKTAISVSNNTASFSAFSASAGTLTATSETDFLFFNNGQAMEHDALQIQQSEGTFYLIADSDSLGYNLANDDEIKGWGKFEPAGYLKFDGLTNEVTTNFSGSGATPVNKTYSWWMNTSVSESNQGVFAYGTNKREAFLINVSQSSMGKPKFSFANHMYKFFMTEDHEEDGGGSTGNGDSGASDATAHIEAQDDGQWHHWMVFSDVSALQNCKLYIDGVEQDTAKFANTGTLHTQQDSLTIGATNDSRTNGVHFEGFITNFAVYSQGNDASDYTSRAVSHYNNGIPKDLSGESGLSAYWKMDEGSGTTVADSIGGNDGTLTSWDGAPLPEWITAMEIEERIN